MSAEAYPFGITIQPVTPDGLAGWVVAVPRDASEWRYGPYLTRADAERVTARLIRALEQQGCVDG